MNAVFPFLTHADSTRTVWITDFDGVLYRGMFPRWTQGISNAEFGLAFWALHASHPVRSMRILRGLVHVGRLRTCLYRRYRMGECTLGDAEEVMIRQFVERVLRPGLPERIRPAAYWAARFCDQDALGALCEVRRKVAAVVVLSKAFAPVLTAAGERMRNECGVDPILRGVPLTAAPKLRIGEGDAVLTARDKSDFVRSLAVQHPEWTRTVCVGDTEEDALMFEAVREVFGGDNACCVVVPARDPVIRDAADTVFESWKAFGQALRG